MQSNAKNTTSAITQSHAHTQFQSQHVRDDMAEETIPVIVTCYVCRMATFKHLRCIWFGCDLMFHRRNKKRHYVAQRPFTHTHTCERARATSQLIWKEKKRRLCEECSGFWATQHDPWNYVDQFVIFVSSRASSSFFLFFSISHLFWCCRVSDFSTSAQLFCSRIMPWDDWERWKIIWFIRLSSDVLSFHFCCFDRSWWPRYVAHEQPELEVQ